MAKHFAVRSRRTTITHGVHRDAVSCGFRDQLVRDTCGEWLIHEAAFGLCGLVAFNTLFGVIACLAFQNARHHAADTAITLVEHVEVIRITVSKRNTARRIWACAIAK